MYSISTRRRAGITCEVDARSAKLEQTSLRSARPRRKLRYSLRDVFNTCRLEARVAATEQREYGKIRNSLTIVVRKASSLPTITAGRTMIAFGKAAVTASDAARRGHSPHQFKVPDVIGSLKLYGMHVAPNRTRVWAILKRDGTLSLTERPVHLVGKWLHQIRDRGSALRRDEHLDRHARHQPHVVGLRRGLFHELQLSDVMLLRR